MDKHFRWKSEEKYQTKVPGLAFINKLQPITYNLDLEAADNIIQKHFNNNSEGKFVQSSKQESAARLAKEKIADTGFVAQDVEKAAKELGYDFSGVDAAKNDKDLYGLRYADFVVPLVKAVQELSAKNDSLQDQIVIQQKTNNDLQDQITGLKNMIQTMAAKSGVAIPQTNETGSASLQQNIPNPFNHTTTINYTLPQTYSSAKIVVTDKNGSVLKELNASATGKGSLNMDASILSSGAYQYSLYVDGKLIDTRQMVLAK